jgi:deoxyhypusine synthase
VQAEFFSDAVSGHRYALQIVTDVPHFGGASGSTLEEAQSWGKLAADAAQVTVHADVTIALPILATALAHSSQELVQKRKRPTFDPSRREMLVEGAPVSRDAFEEKGS